MSSLRVELDIFEATNPTSTAQTHLSQPLGVEDGLRNDALPTAQQTACEQFHFCATFCAALNPDRIFASSNRGCLQVVLWYRLHWGVSVTARPGYVRRPHLLLLLHLTQRLCRASPASRSQRKLRFLQDTSRRRTLYHAAPHHLTTPRLHAQSHHTQSCDLAVNMGKSRCSQHATFRRPHTQHQVRYTRKNRSTSLVHRQLMVNQ